MGTTIEQQSMGETAGRTRTESASATDVTNVPGPADLFGRWTPTFRRIGRRKALLGVLGVAAAGLFVLAVRSGVGNLGAPEQPLVYYTVTRGDLPITVIERGNLESQNNVDIFCEVDDINGDGINGTTILWIVPNGSSVQEGDLLVELDVAGHQERLDQQILDVERARAEQIQARVKYENQITQNETAKANAELQVELARLELDMFKDEDKGTHRLDVEAIKREIEDVDNNILAAQADLELKKNDMEGIDTLFKLGYAGKSERDRSRLDYLKAEGTYAAQINKLSTQMATLEKKLDYERRMQLLKLEGALETAQRDSQQVLKDNQAKLEQAQAAMESADEQFEKEKELLTRYTEAVDNCEIHAPADGMVAFATAESRYSQEIREGAAVRPRQKIITLPNLQKMQVRTAVHESVLDRVRCDLPATIRVDAFPDVSYRGKVQSVAVLPDRGGWTSADTKTYKTIVTIDEDVEQLKPGMSAVVEIHVDRLKDILSIPVQAVVQVERDTWCYVNKNGRPEKRPIDLGITNDKFVEIRAGLAEGDRVVLNPMAILDESEQGDTNISPDAGEPESTTDEQTEPRPDTPAEPEMEKRRDNRNDNASPSDRRPRGTNSRENTGERAGRGRSREPTRPAATRGDTNPPSRLGGRQRD